jgi:putative ABC transport system ATP-binding protein
MNIPVLAENLTKTYADGPVPVTAVSDVHLKLNEGEVVGLFGPSGSGKTTLLSLLGCILRPTGGSLRLFGTDVAGLDESRLPDIRKRYVSFIFQGFNLFPALSAYENVHLLLTLKGIKREPAHRKTLDMLANVRLSHRAAFLPRDLSGGEKQRVAIARALAADTPLILADEPTGNLDHANGRIVMELLKRLATEKGRCVVVATHDTRVEDLLDRILHMEDGRIIREET